MSIWREFICFLDKIHAILRFFTKNKFPPPTQPYHFLPPKPIPKTKFHFSPLPHPTPIPSLSSDHLPKHSSEKFWRVSLQPFFYLVQKCLKISIINIFFIIINFFWLLYQNIKLGEAIYHSLRTCSRESSRLHNTFCCYNWVFK